MATKNKIALITGGSRGLGRNMALSLAQKGTDILFTYNSNRQAADEVAAEIEALGRKAWSLQLDTTDSSRFDRFLEQAGTLLQEHTGSPNFDFLINNAGTGIYVPFTDTTEEQLDAMFNMHYKGVYLLTQKAMRYMNDRGRIVNISSGLARFTQPGSSAYGAMKAAVEALTRYQARELGTRGITANVVAPGPVATDFGGGRVRDNKDINDHLSSITPLGRVGLPDDIGGVVAFLCSEDARWVNGQRIEVSGGILI